MRRDTTEFRLRFLRWKNGELVYKDGLPRYEGGKDSYPILGGKIIADALKEQYRYNNDIEYRFKIKDRNLPEASEVKIPFINNKRIALTNAGLSTGAVISENMLDTIAKYAKAAGIPIKTALGIAAKESTLGNPTDDRSVYKILNKESAAYFKEMGTAQHINVGDLINGRELVNFYVDTDPVYYAAKLYAKKHSISNEDYLNKLKGGEKYADFQASQRERFRNKNVIQAAFEYYRDFPHKYNPGQKNYQQLVNKRGDELMSSPEVLNWYKQLSHYEGGKDAYFIRPVTTGGAVFPLPYIYSESSPSVKEAAKPIEMAANFLPYVGTLMDYQDVFGGNLSKIPAAFIGTVSDTFLPGLFSSIKYLNSLHKSMKIAPRLSDKIKYYKAANRQIKSVAGNSAIQAVGTYLDISDIAK